MGEYQLNNWDVSVETGKIIGGFTGVNRGKIINCTNNIKLNIQLLDEIVQDDEFETIIYLGGIAGENKEESLINNCRNNAEIYTNLKFKLVNGNYRITRIGGVIGSNKGKIINSVNNAKVEVIDTQTGERNSTEAKIGGIAGINNDTASISETTNVINYGDIIVASNDFVNVGGIVGENKVNNNAKIQNAYNNGKIEGSAIENELRIGGIVGEGESIIYRTYNTGKIVANTETKCIGGIIGDIHSDTDVRESKYLAATANGAAEGEEVEGIERVDALGTSDIKQLLNEGVIELNVDNNLIEWQNI